jgi:hypothetical protein
MHDQFPALGLEAPARRGASAHATAGDARSNAAATIRGGASICESKIPYLRTFALPIAWSPRGTNENQPGGSRLQSEENVKHPRRTPTGFSATNRLKQPEQQYNPAKIKKRCSGTRSTAFPESYRPCRNRLTSRAFLLLTFSSRYSVVVVPPPPAASFFACFSRASRINALRDRRTLFPSIESTFTST